jgi:hypothetical protein
MSYCPNLEPKIWRQSLRLSASSVLSRAFRAVAAALLPCVMKRVNRQHGIIFDISFGIEVFFDLCEWISAGELV